MSHNDRILEATGWKLLYPAHGGWTHDSVKMDEFKTAEALTHPITTVALHVLVNQGGLMSEHNPYLDDGDASWSVELVHLHGSPFEESWVGYGDTYNEALREAYTVYMVDKKEWPDE